MTRRLLPSLRSAVEVVIALGVLAGAFIGIDQYFARRSVVEALAGDVKGMAKQIEKGQLKSDVRALKQERAVIKGAEERGQRPTPYERERLREIDEQITDAEKDLRKP